MMVFGRDKKQLSIKILVLIKTINLTFGATHLFPLQISNGSSYYYNSIGNNKDSDSDNLDYNYNHATESVRGGKAYASNHNYNSVNSLSYNNNKNSLAAINSNALSSNNELDNTNVWPSSTSNNGMEDSLSSLSSAPSSQLQLDPAPSSSNVGYEATGMASNSYGHSYTLGVGHGHHDNHHYGGNFGGGSGWGNKGQPHHHSHGYTINHGQGWTPPLAIPTKTKTLHYQIYPIKGHGHSPYLHHHGHHQGWHNGGFGGWNHHGGYILGQSFGWNYGLDLWDSIVGWFGLKGVGLGSILKSLLIIVPAALLIIFLILLIPIPFFSSPTCARSTANQAKLLWTETSRLTQKVLNSEECVERISCELSRVAKKYDKTAWIDAILKNVPTKYQSTKWMDRISRSLDFDFGLDHEEGKDETTITNREGYNKNNKCSKFTCNPLTQLKKAVLTSKNNINSNVNVADDANFQANVDTRKSKNIIPPPVLKTTTPTTNTSL